jgi:hypothetical protein
MRRRVLLASSAVSAVTRSGRLADIPIPFDGGETQPNPDHDVILRNEYDETREFTVEVIRTRTETVVHERSVSLEPRTERTTYNLRHADPDGVEWFEITGSVGDVTKTTEIRTDSCYRNAYVTLDADGELGVYHSICCTAQTRQNALKNQRDRALRTS